MKPFATLAVLGLTAIVSGCVTTPQDEGGREAAQYNVQLGLEYLNQGRRELALEKLNRAIRQDPRYANAHLAIAYAYSQLGEDSLARESYRRALRYGGDDPNIHNTYGTFLCETGDLRGAERHLLIAARDVGYGTPAVAWTNAGLCAEKIPDLDKAEDYFREALRVDGRHADALWQMAELSLETGNALQARAFLQRYIEVAPRSATSLWLGYQVERALADDPAAAVYAARLRSDFADSPEARMLEDAERGRGN